MKRLIASAACALVLGAGAAPALAGGSCTKPPPPPPPTKCKHDNGKHLGWLKHHGCPCHGQRSGSGDDD